MNNKNYVGENVWGAEGPFYCAASGQEIKEELPTIRKLVETPPSLELYLTDMNNRNGDEGGDLNINFTLKATAPGGTYDPVTELEAIFNQTYQSPLYKPEEPFYGEVTPREFRITTN